MPKSKKETLAPPKTDNNLNTINIKKISTSQNIIINNNIITGKSEGNNLNLTKSFLSKIENKRIFLNSPVKPHPPKSGNNTTTNREFKTSNLNINITVINNTVSPVSNPIRKKDAETQTEDVFFKSHWTYFQAKNYTVLSAKTSNSNKLVMSTIINSRVNGFSGMSGLLSNNNLNINPNSNLHSNSKTKSYSLDKRAGYSITNSNGNVASGSNQENTDYLPNSNASNNFANNKINFANAIGGNKTNLINKINSMGNLNDIYKNSIKRLSSGGNNKD